MTPTLTLVDLDVEGVRKHMATEIAADITNGTLYKSRYLSEIGWNRYPRLLSEAARLHDAGWLAAQFAAAPTFKRTYPRRNRAGRSTDAAVPNNAATTLAEGEFNRFYIRGLALHAADVGIAELQVYRAKPVAEPRPKSTATIGHLIAAADILLDLRLNHRFTFHGVPAGPGSGLSLSLPRETADQRTATALRHV